MRFKHYLSPVTLVASSTFLFLYYLIVPALCANCHFNQVIDLYFYITAYGLVLMAILNHCP